jgi:DNA-binding HxlR family transcriptional regulator
MRPKRFDAKSGCAVGVTLSVIGGLWKPLILFHLFTGKKRFMELCRAIPQVTQRILTIQLRELEADGVIVRHAYPQIPPKVEYEISPFGRSLGPILIALRSWGEQYEESAEGAARRHSVPDARIQARAPCNVS